jgi:uncharacterized DUF497 family protein
MRDDEFEWDDAKAAANLARHGVSFEVARRAFDDPHAMVRDDLRERYGEDRYTLLGVVSDKLYYVAYTLREPRIRIISARGAEPYERRLYREAKR